MPNTRTSPGRAAVLPRAGPACYQGLVRCGLWARGKSRRCRRSGSPSARDVISVSVTAFVYKVCSRSAWRAAELSGEVALSEADRRDGFVHLSTRAQLPGTLAKHFQGQKELVLLTVPTERLLSGTLRWEPSRGGELFPHLYGSLDAGAVCRVQAIETDGSGAHRLPEP